MKTSILKILHAIILLFSFSSISYSQFLWEQLPGLEGGKTAALASNSLGEIFVGGSGVFKSTDNGNYWAKKDSEFASGVISLAIKNNDFIFAGTFNSGIYRSTDNGENWTLLTTPAGLKNVRNIVFNDSGYIFACTGPSPFSGKVFRSTNNGDNWTNVTNNLPGSAVFSLTIDSSNNIYAGSGFNAGVYISTNNGDNWTATGLTNATTMSLTVDKLNDVIYAGTYTDILKSTDSGQTWSSTGLSGNIWALSTTVAGEVFAGTWAGSIYRSSDSGTSWVNLINELTIVEDILITQSGDIFAGTFGPGVFYSADDGNNWENKSAGIDFLSIRDAHIAPNGNIFAASGMVYRSTNAGANWSYVKGGRGNSYYSSIISNDQGYLYASSGGGSGGYWIYRSTDNGGNWLRINNGLTDSTIWTIALDSLENLFIGTQAGIFRSSNGGNSWEQALNIPQNVYSLTIDS